MSLRGKSVRREPSSHPLREGAERIEIYLKAPRHPANHNSDAWDSGDEAKTLDCNIPKMDDSNILFTTGPEATFKEVCALLKNVHSAHEVEELSTVCKDEVKKLNRRINLNL